jgi:hypothetical protein
VNASMILHIVSLILAPVVMISSTTLLLNGILGRYENVSARMRVLYQERLQLLLNASGDIVSADDVVRKINRERICEIDQQIPTLMLRHKILHYAVLVVDIAILIFVVDMLVFGFSDIEKGAVWLDVASLLVFVAAMATLLLGIALTAIEIHRSHHEVLHEAQQGLDLGQEWKSLWQQ